MLSIFALILVLLVMYIFVLIISNTGILRCPYCQANVNEECPYAKQEKCFCDHWYRDI